MEAARRARQVAALTDDQTAIPSLGGGEGACAAASEGSGDEWEGASDEEAGAAGGEAASADASHPRSRAVDAFYAALSRPTGSAPAEAESGSAAASVRRAAAPPSTALQAMAQLRGMSSVLGEGESLVDDLAPQPVRGVCPSQRAACYATTPRRAHPSFPTRARRACCVHSWRFGRRTWRASWRTWQRPCSGILKAWRGCRRGLPAWSPSLERAGARPPRSGEGGWAPCGGGSGTHGTASTRRCRPVPVGGNPRRPFHVTALTLAPRRRPQRSASDRARASTGAGTGQPCKVTTRAHPKRGTRGLRPPIRGTAL